MKKNNNHTDIYTHLTQEELLEYSQGMLGNDEMYRLELHLNECELCSDALEGFENIKQPKQILASIHTQIIPSSKKKGNSYLAIAASLSLIAVLGFSYWLITDPKENNTIALNSPVESEIVNANKDKIQEEVVEPIPEITDIETEEDITESEVKTSASTLNQPAPKLAQVQKPVLKPEKVAEASRKEELIATSSANQAEDELADTDDQSNEIVTELTNENQGIAQEPTSMPARSAKKVSSDAQPRLTDQKEPSPIGGMAALKKYFSSNLVYPKEALDNKIKGTVVLEVTIAQDGSIKNMVVTKSIGYGCDTEAMRLISAGPNWTTAVIKGKPVESKKQVKIKFKN